MDMPIELRLVETTIYLRKPRPRVEKIFWPTLSMKSWCEVLMERFPEYLLGGFQEDTSWMIHVGKIF